MNLLTADYVILSISALAGVAGLFIGFSGAAAFLAATVVASLAGRFFWPLSGEFLATGWSRGLVTLIVALLVFGLVRWAVRRVVNGLLHQPADSIFGFLVAALAGIVLSSVVVYLIGFFGLAEVPSAFVSEAMGLV